jgi:Na+(H+)/acetate symporter ActP
MVAYPAAVSVPLAFATMVLVSKMTKRQIPADLSRIFTRMHAPERIGVGSDRERELRSP